MATPPASTTCRIIPVSEKSCIVDGTLYALEKMCEADFKIVLEAVKDVWHPDKDLFTSMFGQSSWDVPGRQALHSMCVRVLKLNCRNYHTQQQTLCETLRQFVACWYQQQYANSMRTTFVPCVSLFRFQDDGGRVIQEVDSVRRVMSNNLDLAQNQLMMETIIRDICNISARYRSNGFTFRIVASDEVTICPVGAEEEAACPKFLSMEPVLDQKWLEEGFLSVEDTLDMMVYFITNRKSHDVLSRFDHHLSALSYIIFSSPVPITSETIRKHYPSNHRDLYILAVGLMAFVMFEWLRPCYEDPSCLPTRSALDSLDPHTRKLQQAAQLQQSVGSYQPPHFR